MPDPSTAVVEGAPRVVARAHAVGKSYPDGRGVRVVLEDVDVEVRAGGIVGVQGPSGCGKTTLLEIVAGLLRPDRGTVEILAEPLDFDRRRDVAATRRDHIGLISQDYRLLPDESVAENVALPLRFGRSRPGRAQRRILVAQALQDATLDVDPRRKVRTLSGGERQRVAIARALVRKPDLLIADEPTAALDADTAATIIKLLEAVAGRGTAVLLATHDPAAAQACDVVHRFTGPKLHQDADQTSQ